MRNVVVCERDWNENENCTSQTCDWIPPNKDKTKSDSEDMARPIQS